MNFVLLNILSFVLCTAAVASNTKQVQIAYDASENVMYTAQAQNSDGIIHVIDTADTANQFEIGSIQVPNVSADTVLELALSKDKSLFVLARSNEKSNLYAYQMSSQNGARSWQKSDLTADTSAIQSVHSLHAEKDGRVSVVGIDSASGEEVMEFYSTGKDSNAVTLTKVDQLDAAMIEVSETKAKAKVEEKEGTYTKGTGLGFSAGFLSGIGFAFRKFYSNGFGTNIAAGAIATDNRVNVSAGLEIMKTLDETESFRFFALTGAGYNYDSNKYSMPDPNSPHDPMSDPVMIETTDKDTTINVGIGLGVEYAPAGLQKKGIALSLDCAYAVRFEKQNNYYTNNKDMHYAGLAPMPSFSIIYYFRR